MAPGRKAGAINSGVSGNPAGGRSLPMGGIHSLYCTVLYAGTVAFTPTTPRCLTYGRCARAQGIAASAHATRFTDRRLDMFGLHTRFLTYINPVALRYGTKLKYCFI